MSPERFEGPKKSCRLKTCDINFINEMGADTMILAPLTIREFDFSKKYFFCFRLLQKLHNDGEFIIISSSRLMYLIIQLLMLKKYPLIITNILVMNSLLLLIKKELFH